MTAHRALAIAAAGLAVALLGNAPAFGFSLTSPDLRPGDPVPEQHLYGGFGCDGANVSPGLEWTNPPEGTRSFALLVHDPDAPSGGAGWWHWVLHDLPADTTSLPQGSGAGDGRSLPPGTVQRRNDFGERGWGGPCPVAGSRPHRYVFSLHALKVERLDVPNDASAAMVGYQVNAQSIARAVMTVRHARPK
jgi:Raf kinase inhibitor-like YbhB/YbcL family protein